MTLQKQENNKNFKVHFALLFGLVFIIMPKLALGASLYFETVTKNIYAGERFEAILKLDAQNQSINAIEGKISLSDNLEVKELVYGDSIITLWIQKPIQKNNEIIFSGIIPGGYEGNLSPYWKGFKPGNILKLIFLAEKPGIANVGIKDVKTLLNDGKGTEAPLSVSDLELAIAEGVSPSAGITTEEDKIQPAEFTPQIARDLNIFGGQWFLVFETRDNESGIGHYKIYESRKEAADGKNIKWKTTESPYLLKDQGLKSYIYVKAVDLSGNERVVFLPPQKQLSWYDNYLIWIIIILVIIIGYAIKKILRNKNIKK